MCVLLAVAVMFSACGGDSSSNDDGFSVPDLHPENYPAVNTKSEEYKGSRNLIDQAGTIYNDALDYALGEAVSGKIKTDTGKILRSMRLKRASSDSDTYDLSYTGEGYTVTGSVVFSFSGPNEFPYTYLIDMKVVFTDYTISSLAGDIVSNGTMCYKSKGTWSSAGTMESTTYVSGDISMDIGGVAHSIQFEDVYVASTVDGTGTYIVKSVFTIDGTQYGYQYTGEVIVVDDEDDEGDME